MHDCKGHPWQGWQDCLSLLYYNPHYKRPRQRQEHNLMDQVHKLALNHRGLGLGKTCSYEAILFCGMASVNSKWSPIHIRMEYPNSLHYSKSLKVSRLRISQCPRPIWSSLLLSIISALKKNGPRDCADTSVWISKCRSKSGKRKTCWHKGHFKVLNVLFCFSWSWHPFLCVVLMDRQPWHNSIHVAERTHMPLGSGERRVQIRDVSYHLWSEPYGIG